MTIREMYLQQKQRESQEAFKKKKAESDRDWNKYLQSLEKQFTPCDVRRDGDLLLIYDRSKSRLFKINLTEPKLRSDVRMYLQMHPEIK